MIQISLTTALVMYSAILGLVVFAIWAYTELTTRRSYHVLEKQDLWRCVFCGYVYLDERAERVSRCPQCGSFNSEDDKRARYVRSRRASPRRQEPAPAGPKRNTSHRKRPHQRRRGPRKRR